jgi:hypothetical protein
MRRFVHVISGAGLGLGVLLVLDAGLQTFGLFVDPNDPYSPLFERWAVWELGLGGGLLLLGFVSLCAVRRWRPKAPPHAQCLACGYDLAGLRAGAPCPECARRPRDNLPV